MTIEKQFGIHAFNCLNKKKITTVFLMRFFNHFYKIPLFLRLVHVFPDADMIASFFLKTLMDFKPFVFLWKKNAIMELEISETSVTWVFVD